MNVNGTNTEEANKIFNSEVYKFIKSRDTRQNIQSDRTGVFNISYNIRFLLYVRKQLVFDDKFNEINTRHKAIFTVTVLKFLVD